MDHSRSRAAYGRASALRKRARLKDQVIVLLTFDDMALCSPSVVYEATAKYQVPAARPPTTYCTVAGLDMSTTCERLPEFVP